MELCAIFKGLNLWWAADGEMDITFLVGWLAPSLMHKEQLSRKRKKGPNFTSYNNIIVRDEGKNIIFPSQCKKMRASPQ